MGKTNKSKGYKKKKYKDPLQLQNIQLSKIAHKINRVPTNEEIQEIPKKLKLMVDFQEKLQNKAPRLSKKERKMKKKNKAKASDNLIDTAKLASKATLMPGMERPLHMIPRLKQYPDESDDKFLRRVNMATMNMLKESEYEDKFGVDVERHADGKIKAVKARNILDDPALSDKQRAKLLVKQKLKKEKKKERDLKRKLKNRKKAKDEDEFSYFTDKVKFGEVVYEPPSLDTSKLTKMIGGEMKSKSFLFMEKLKKDQSGKIQELTAARKRTLEDERQKAVQAYRDMKAEKFKANSKNFTFG
ncbi:hypothetical protein SK128_001992 [Halocaridina rubra]|uniref:Coiled-coil domain-containing protein 137 n=1 Tax=Halocaridina rubra TaxID=373956 RepID=A0AAN8XDB9_HALRR